MLQILHDIKVDWLGNRLWFIGISVLLMLAGLASAIFRQATGGQAFNLGVDFKGGTVVTAKFKQKPSDEAIRSALVSKGVRDAVVQPVTDKPDTVLIKVPLEGEGQDGRVKVREALNTFGGEAPASTELEADQNAVYKIIGTDAVGAIAGAQLRNKAIAVTLAALVGILVYIAFRFEWTYGAAAVIAVFHDVLVTLGFFSIFQFEVSLTVIAALLTLVGFSVNDTIVVFDRIRENRKLHRRDSLYKITNDAINQTLSRTVITSGLVFLSVLAMVLFGGEVLRGFSLALLIGIVFGTYSSVAIASPIMVWWEQRIEAANRQAALAFNQPVKGGVRTPAKASAKASNRRAGVKL
ncbi:MAG TPA: protein translocase subunit SecF [Pyrinomonadaceae bacterium]|jgi:preprotein translocase subunit SecF|nr:protein translocase subunit SecF [Pyrinomonadaceae bacterium]